MKRITMNRISDKSIFKKIGVFLMAALLPSITASAQTANSSADSEVMFYIVIGLVFFVTILVLFTAILTLQVLKTIVNRDLEKKAAESGAVAEEEPGLVGQLMNKLTDAVPIEKEKDVLLDHDYDGIKELDNHLPPWWLYLFYFTIAFGIVYLLAYHVFDRLPLQDEEYQTELAMAAEQRASMASTTEAVDENTIEYVEDASMIASGAKVYGMQCASCHAADGGGIVGPNLTDKYWLHGGGIKNIFKTLRYGVPEKGMIAWEGVISNSQMRDVSMFVMSLEGTTPANPKEAQGEIYNDGDVSSSETISEEAAAPSEATEAEETVEATGEDTALGKTVYDQNCVACHMADGGGGVGPNFTDEYWLHGCSKEEIVALINKGVPIKGMIAWENVLSEEQISAVADYILAFGGTTPASPKDPQGDSCTN